MATEFLRKSKINGAPKTFALPRSVFTMLAVLRQLWHSVTHAMSSVSRWVMLSCCEIFFRVLLFSPSLYLMHFSDPRRAKSINRLHRNAVVNASRRSASSTTRSTMWVQAGWATIIAQHSHAICKTISRTSAQRWRRVRMFRAVHRCFAIVLAAVKSAKLRRSRNTTVCLKH